MLKYWTIYPYILQKGKYVRTGEWKEQLRLRLLGNKYTLGRKLSEEHKQKLRLAHLGYKPSKEAIEKTSQSILGEKNGRWKGDSVGTDALHQWVRKYFSEPDVCQFCQQDKKLDLANMTGIYNRDFSNWKYLCRKCHNYHDGTVNNLKPFQQKI